MFYTELPHIDNIVWLSKLAQPFPTNIRRVREAAELWGFNKSTLEFLDKFPNDQQFASREDFLNRCDDIEARMYERRSMTESA